MLFRLGNPLCVVIGMGRSLAGAGRLVSDQVRMLGFVGLLRCVARGLSLPCPCLCRVVSTQTGCVIAALLV